ncbi:hypothetical protein CaCOL14_012101 [Colletotrichum acutatum]
MRFTTIFASVALLCACYASADNSTYLNPVLSGWHSDPSCVQVNGTFFCATSSFLTFPGIPIYASKDLINWSLISHVWSRESQLPGVSWNTTAAQGGLYAPTIRYHIGEFYVSSVYIVSTVDIEVFGAVFKSADPFDIDGWSDPVRFETSWRIDPDLFWDDDDTLYVATSGILLQTLDLGTGDVGDSVSIWNGTGGESPEGPHIYKKDGWYYLLIAEGGTGLRHSVTISRSANITGPYMPYDQNPILTNRDTDAYFQTVGHADLFQDAEDNWWGMCLTTRSGPEYEIYPMGREAALFPVSWGKGKWPVLDPVRGVMGGWKLPATLSNVFDGGVRNTDPDIHHFSAGSEVPLNFIYPRVPPSTVVMTDRGMQIIPTRSNLTGTWDAEVELTGQHGIGFIGREQADTIFEFSMDITFSPQAAQEEAGVSVFLTQYDHIDLGIVLHGDVNRTCNEHSYMYFRFGTQSTVHGSTSRTIPVPGSWTTQPIRLEIISNNTTYTLSAKLAADPDNSILIGTAAASIVSGGSGSFVGSLVGGFATCNGAGTGDKCPHDNIAFVHDWKYYGLEQQISATEIVESPWQ